MLKTRWLLAFSVVAQFTTLLTFQHTLHKRFSFDAIQNQQVTQAAVAETPSDISKPVGSPEIQESPEHAAQALMGSQAALEAVVSPNITEGDLPKGLSKLKEEKINSKSTFMTGDMGDAAEVLSEVGPMGTGEEEGNPDAVKFKMEALETMRNISSTAIQHQALPAAESTSTATPLHPSTRNAASEFFRAMEALDISSQQRAAIQQAKCIKAYSNPCPENFVSVGDSCWALSEYSGPCNPIQTSLSQMTDAQKRAWESACLASWSCSEKQECDHGIDWRRNCPIEWEDDGNGTCKPLSSNIVNLTHRPDCPSEFVYRGLSLKEKQDYSQRCGLQWPCRRLDCSLHDFSQPCPEGWVSQTSGVCVAPAKYQGPCPRYADLENFSERLKKNFEIVCFAPWPCAWECNRDYSRPCPLGWLPLTVGQECQAPVEYNGKLPRRYNFQKLPQKQRALFAEAYGVFYPCQDRSGCPRDTSPTCPIDWQMDSDGVHCRSLFPASTPCKGLIPFNTKNITTEEKLALAANCHAEFPCKSEYPHI